AVLPLIMVVSVKLSQWLLSLMISPDGRLGPLITVAICSGIGGLGYGLLATRTGVLERGYGGVALAKIQRILGSRCKIKFKSRVA
ncbi:polysaccharide biosynthesis protein, partial [Bacillus cereus]|nr:polysaccharide biosynthesis protein [Bacillus cereus]